MGTNSKFAVYSKNAIDMGTFRCYICANGTNVIRAWYDAQSPDVQGELAGVLVALESLSPGRWPENLFKPLQRKSGSNCEGLDELILVVDRIHYRIIGYRGPRDDDFTMLYPFDKSISSSYKLPCEEAHRRKMEIDRDWNRSQEHQFP